MPEELDGFGVDLRFRTSSPNAIQNCFKTFIIGLRSMSDLDDLYPREYGLQNYTSRLINGKTWPRRKILGLYTKRLDAERIIEERPEDLYAGQFKVVVLVNTFVGLCVSPVALHQGFVFSRKFGKYMCMTATNLQSTPQATRIRLANSPLYGALYDNYMTPAQMDRAHFNGYVRWMGYDPERGLSDDPEVNAAIERYITRNYGLPQFHDIHRGEFVPPQREYHAALELDPAARARLLQRVENTTLVGEGRLDSIAERRVNFDIHSIRREFDERSRTRNNEPSNPVND